MRVLKKQQRSTTLLGAYHIQVLSCIIPNPLIPLSFYQKRPCGMPESAKCSYSVGVWECIINYNDKMCGKLILCFPSLSLTILSHTHGTMGE